MIFDRDEINKKGIRDIFNKDKLFNDHTNNVYSIFIPPIDDKHDICIEWYYNESDLKTLDKNGRRLFLGKEFKNFEKIFDKCFQRQIINDNQIYRIYRESKPKDLEILDGGDKIGRKKVYKFDDLEKRNNLALSKNDFAENIYNDVKRFNNFDIGNFKLIFDIIKQIVNH